MLLAGIVPDSLLSVVGWPQPAAELPASHSLSGMQGESNRKSSCVELRTGRSLTSFHCRQKRLDAGKGGEKGLPLVCLNVCLFSS